MRFKGYWVSQAGQHHGGRPLRSSTNAWARTISPQERFQGGRGNTPGFSFGVYRNASWIILRWGDVEGNLTRDRDHHSTHPGRSRVRLTAGIPPEGRKDWVRVSEKRTPEFATSRPHSHPLHPQRQKEFQIDFVTKSTMSSTLRASSQASISSRVRDANLPPHPPIPLPTPPAGADIDIYTKKKPPHPTPPLSIIHHPTTNVISLFYLAPGTTGTRTKKLLGRAPRGP